MDRKRERDSDMTVARYVAESQLKPIVEFLTELPTAIEGSSTIVENIGSAVHRYFSPSDTVLGHIATVRRLYVPNRILKKEDIYFGKLKETGPMPWFRKMRHEFTNINYEPLSSNQIAWLVVLAFTAAIFRSAVAFCSADRVIPFPRNAGRHVIRIPVDFSLLMRLWVKPIRDAGRWRKNNKTGDYERDSFGEIINFILVNLDDDESWNEHPSICINCLDFIPLSVLSEFAKQIDNVKEGTRHRAGPAMSGPNTKNVHNYEGLEE